jgi:hypothetical protein
MQVAVEAAAQEIVDRGLVYYADLDGEPRTSKDAPATTSKIIAIISKHCTADAGEVERLQGELRKERARCYHEHVPLDSFVGLKKERDSLRAELTTARANAIRECVDAVNTMLGGCTIQVDTGRLVADPGGPWFIKSDVVRVLESLAKEGDDGPTCS